MDGPLNVIADTFSRLLRLDDTSALVGKKAIPEDSELSNYSIFDDKETFNCLLHLPCFTSRKRQSLNSRRENDMINVTLIFLKI